MTDDEMSIMAAFTDEYENLISVLVVCKWLITCELLQAF